MASNRVASGNHADSEAECSGSHGPTDPPAQIFSDTLKFDARTLEVGVTRNWARSVDNWNLALDPSGGPHLGGCGTCTGVITVGPGQTVSRNAEYYALGHLSRFVRPGAARIGSTSFGTTGWNGQITDVAFRNPDGTTVLVAHNENDNPQTFGVTMNGLSFTRTLPGGSLATFTWPSLAADEHIGPTLDPARMSATASPAAPTNPCCTGDVAASAIDEDATTRWSTGQAQAAGQYLQIGLGAGQRVHQLTLDTGTSTGDYPRAFVVTTSQDGVHWSSPIARGRGSGQLTTVDVPGAGRFILVTLTEASSSWWSVAAPA